MSALLTTKALTVSIGGHTVCEGLDWSVSAGQHWAILGRNGAGKSTLLHTLAGLHESRSGTIAIDGHSANLTSPKVLAKVRGILPQRQLDPFASTVLETVLVGRHPHLDRWDWESAEDRRIALNALEQVGLLDFSQRDVLTLSGGERQRLAIAQLLTQQPRLMLLDEPLTHLDLNYQVAVMELMKQQVAAGAAVVSVLHDPGFAARYCDHALLLFGTGTWLAGPADEVLTAQNLSCLYGHTLHELTDQDGQRWFVPA
ncbi:MAG TPA: ABC transporter ATP-binding protein [Rhodocyclaceae bacterium]|nr:ABC transporter ATP-binding protein [Rhodocyclaceae bacterium]